MDAFVRKVLEESIEKLKKQCFERSIGAPNEDLTEDPKEKRGETAAKESSEAENREDSNAEEAGDPAAAAPSENPESNDDQEGIPRTPEVKFSPSLTP